jgi:hypothetical protein
MTKADYAVMHFTLWFVMYMGAAILYRDRKTDGARLFIIIIIYPVLPLSPS